MPKAADHFEETVSSALRDEFTCTVLRLVQENPGITGAKLEERAGLDQQIIQACLSRLISTGLVEADAGGYSIREAAREALIRQLPLNYQCPGLLYRNYKRR